VNNKDLLVILILEENILTAEIKTEYVFVFVEKDILEILQTADRNVQLMMSVPQIWLVETSSAKRSVLEFVDKMQNVLL